jgi:hypothetical protein
VRVAPLVTAQAAASSVRLGHAVTILGSVRPNLAGHQVVLQHWWRGVWRDIATTTLGPRSGYSFSVRPTLAGPHAYRVRRPSGPLRAAGTSPEVLVSVTA